ncbi:MAG: response regulator transcription factor [Planctomycetes bacterium]|nr:response regulator transcription factor [Planctomycetota bacterium]
MSHNVLLIEDEISLAETMCFNLESEGYQVDHAASLTAARSVITLSATANTEYDLIILDVMLPDGNGVDFAHELRKQHNHTPILMLTALNSTSNVVDGLEAGADDYMSKPFALAELLVRIKALLRRQIHSRPKLAATTQHSFGRLLIDLRNGNVTGGKKDFMITDIELKLLNYFLQHPLEELSRDDIMTAVWDVPSSVKSRTLDNFVMRLRKLFEVKHADPKHFLTVYGVGYRFVP